jgi:dTDP-4-dehydrorhamnose 3,5-epimerase
MPIEIENTSIPEVKIISATRFYDSRGFFTETFKESEYRELGIMGFVQDNLSESSKGVIRGLHWQDAPYGQGKLVSCLSGRILDVAVDIRKNSHTFGNYVAVELTAKESKALWVPEGFAHGFQSLEDETRVHYKVTSYWKKESEKSLNYSDKDVNIKWHEIPIRMSEKDLEAPTLKSLLNGE